MFKLNFYKTPNELLMQSENLEFIKTIPNFIEQFNEDEKFIIELVGIDNFLKIYNRYSKTGLYFSNVSFMKLKKIWCVNNTHLNYNEAARILGVSTKTIFRWRQEGL